MNQIVSGIQFSFGSRYEIKKLLEAWAYGDVTLAIDKKQTDPGKKKVANQKSCISSGIRLIQKEFQEKQEFQEL